MADRSWTIAPMLGWFALLAAGAVVALDGDGRAIANRLTTPRAAETQVAAAGPAFVPAATLVAEADDDPAPAAPSSTGDRGKVGALEDVCLEGTPAACKRWAMDGFYGAVEREARGTLKRPVRVSWYGDSVIATDAIPNRLRSRLQTELGDGGPGFVFAVAPHRFCGSEVIDRNATGGWTTYAVSTTTVADRMYGPGGSTAETIGGRATYKFLGGAASTVELYYLAQPRGGSAVITADRTEGAEILRAAMRADAKGAGFASGAIPEGTKRLVLETTGKVRLFGLAIENASGAVVDNLGIVSVNAKNFVHHDAAHFAAELGHRGADLLMVMIGANEAAWLAPTDHDTRHYAERFEAVLAPLRAGRPDATCLVVSPTDQAEAKDGAYPSRPVMPALIAAQKKAAKAQGCAFFSTYEWMGGRGSAAKWFRRGLVGSDFQHLSRAGSNKFADAVYDALMAGYQRYRGDSGRTHARP